MFNLNINSIPDLNILITFRPVRSSFCTFWLSRTLLTLRYVHKVNRGALCSSWYTIIKALFLVQNGYLLNLGKTRLNILSDVTLSARLPWWRHWQKELSGAVIIATACYDSKAAPPHHVKLTARTACHSSTLTCVLFGSLWRLSQPLVQSKNRNQLDRQSYHCHIPKNKATHIWHSIWEDRK